MEPLEAFNAGQLQSAIDSARENVKANPTEVAERMTLADLLLFIDDYESAERHLEAIAIQQPDLILATEVGREIIHGAQVRKKAFAGEAIPSFLDPVDEVLESQLRLLTHYRESDFETVKSLRQSVIEPYCEGLRGQAGDTQFESFRDLDDTLAACLELITTAGKYYWVAWHRVESLEFEPISRPRDLLFREARISIRQGPEAVVFAPVRYATDVSEQGDDMMLARRTDWREREDTFLGLGQRIFAFGDEQELPILEATSLSFEQGATDASPAASESDV